MRADTAPPIPAYACLLLAAGASSRMGQAKQLMLFRAEPLVGRVARRLSEQNLAPVLAVLGARAEEIAPILDEKNITHLFNPHWESGMGSSIAAGLAGALQRWPDLSGIIVALADHVFLSADLIGTLIQAHQETHSAVVASRYNEESWGSPALFDRSLFDELAKLNGPEGGRKLISRFSAQPIMVNFPLGLLDVDTPDDWEAALSIDSDS